MLRLLRHLFAVMMLSCMAMVCLIGLLLALTGCGGGDTAPAALSTRFFQTNLVSDIPGAAATTDPNLVNPWGMGVSPTGIFWIADNGSGKITLYDNNGAAQLSIAGLPIPSKAALMYTTGTSL